MNYVQQCAEVYRAQVRCSWLSSARVVRRRFNFHERTTPPPDLDGSIHECTSLIEVSHCGFMTLNESPGFVMVRICSTILSEVLNWYCYKNPEDLFVAMSHKNHPSRVW